MMKKHINTKLKLLLYTTSILTILAYPLPRAYKHQISDFVDSLFSISNYPNKATEECLKVLYVIDGDTIVILNENNKEETIRLYGIDAFETQENEHMRRQMIQYWLTKDEVIKKGLEAKEYLKSKIGDGNSCVYVERKGIDKYGRSLGKVWYFTNNNMIDLSIVLITKNLAYRY